MRLGWLPNAICLFRVLLIWPIVLLLVREEYLVALLLIAIAGISDGLDGFFARRFDWHTRLGSVLDPAADKLLTLFVFLTLSYLGLVPFALTVLVVVRDIVIVLGALAYQLLIEPVYGRPALVSKLNSAAQLVFVLSTISAASFGLPSQGVVLVLGATVTFTSIISGLNYVIGRSKEAWRKIYNPVAAEN